MKPQCLDVCLLEGAFIRGARLFEVVLVFPSPPIVPPLSLTLSKDSELCETSLGALTRVLKPRKPKKEKVFSGSAGRRI